MRKWGIVAFLIAVASPAFADPKRWEAGVTARDQERANELFAEANRLYGQQAYAPAIDAYRAALAIWNHPVIRFNLGAQIADYQTKLRDHIGELSASCSNQQTKVSLDGKEWFTCPGTTTIRVLAASMQSLPRPLHSV